MKISNRVFWAGVALSCSAILAVGVGASPAIQSFKDISVRSIKLTDSKNRVRAKLYVANDAAPVLNFYNSYGETILTVAGLDVGPLFGMGKPGDSGLMMTASKSSSNILITNGKGKGSVLIESHDTMGPTISLIGQGKDSFKIIKPGDEPADTSVAVPEYHVPQLLVNLTGDGQKTTDVFEVKSKSWKLSWTAKEDCHFLAVHLKDANTNEDVELLVNTTKPGSDSTIVHRKGAFYLSASGIGSYEITATELP